MDKIGLFIGLKVLEVLLVTFVYLLCSYIGYQLLRSVRMIREFFIYYKEKPWYHIEHFLVSFCVLASIFICVALISFWFSFNWKIIEKYF